jgi:hypothetical protein
MDYKAVHALRFGHFELDVEDVHGSLCMNESEEKGKAVK